ncbi:protein kinase, partial [Acinetobacter baumannii]
LDIKPGNVILSAGRPVLIDFGTARPIGYRAKKSMGTDGYIAPELLAGSALSPAADVFALGVTLIELLAGELPHECPAEFTLDADVIKTL